MQHSARFAQTKLSETLPGSVSTWFPILELSDVSDPGHTDARNSRILMAIRAPRGLLMTVATVVSKSFGFVYTKR